MSKITKDDVEFLKLMLRSPDRGDGWRTVSAVCWKLVEMFPHKELLETDEINKRARLSAKGAIVTEYVT